MPHARARTTGLAHLTSPHSIAIALSNTGLAFLNRLHEAAQRHAPVRVDAWRWSSDDR
jgi:hypothetical protein